jgi:hypothetical protein
MSTGYPKKPKVGRPKGRSRFGSTMSKRIVYQARLTAEEHDELDRLEQESDMNRTEYFRALLSLGYVLERAYRPTNRLRLGEEE